MRTGTLLSVPAFLLVGFFIMSPFASAAQYGGLGGRPADPDPANPRTESIFIHTIEPGTSASDAVRVINNTPEEKTVFVYSADSTPSTDGGFACKQRVEERKTVGAWIEFLPINGPEGPVTETVPETDPSTVNEAEVGGSALTENTPTQLGLTLPPSSSIVIPFFVNVPEGVDVGEHNGCILIQEAKTKEAGSGVSLSFRTGLRVAITIPGEVIRSLEIQSFDANKKNSLGQRIVSGTVASTGNVSIDTNVAVQTSHILGFEYFTQGGQYPVLARDKSTWNYALSDTFWGGWYRSTLVVSYDNSENARIGQNSEKALINLSAQTKWFFVMPAMQAIFIYLAVFFLLLSIIFFFLARRVQRKYRLRTWDIVEVGPNDSLLDIAKKRNCSWRQIARVNHLQAPYQFVKGQHILVPPLKKTAKSKIKPESPKKAAPGKSHKKTAKPKSVKRKAKKKVVAR